MKEPPKMIAFHGINGVMKVSDSEFAYLTTQKEMKVYNLTASKLALLVSLYCEGKLK